MSKFKVGDTVRYTGAAKSYHVGPLVVLDNNWGKDHENHVRQLEGEKFDFYIPDSVTELITSEETKQVTRRTFKLIKNSIGLRKGALVQEECEDGTQPYVLITPEFMKSKGDSSTLWKYRDRSVVEDQPEWFVEVFKVEPEYMTKEELERYHAFTKPAVKVSKTGKRLGRPPKK